jgi:hypothetical protein
MKRGLSIVGLAAIVAAGAVSAHAGCADPRKAGAMTTHTIPSFRVPGLSGAAGADARIVLPPPSTGNAAQDIVGTWLVTYTAGGKRFAQAFIQWHDDGTEWENINLPLSGGNICVGSWKPVDSLHVYRFHIGWLYTAGVLSGYFTETETDKIPHHNSYSGVNDTKVFDLSGNMLAEVPGTANAVRIAP